MTKIALNGFGRLGRIAMGSTIPLQVPNEDNIPSEDLKSLGGKLIVNKETADQIETKVKLTQVDSLDPIGDAKKESEAKKQFNKVFGFLKDIDIPKQYIAIKFKKSNLSKSQRDRLLAYMTIRANNDPKYKEMVDKLDELIAKGLKVGYKNENPNNS